MSSFCCENVYTTISTILFDLTFACLALSNEKEKAFLCKQTLKFTEQIDDTSTQWLYGVEWQDMVVFPRYESGLGYCYLASFIYNAIKQYLTK